MDKDILIERAKAYVRMLAEGVHPLTGKVLPPEMTDEKLLKCFAFVGEILDVYTDLVERMGEEESARGENVAKKKEAFAISEEQRERIRLSSKPISVMYFMKNVNSVVDTATMRKLTSTRVNRWLVARGLFSESKVPMTIQRTVYTPSELAAKMGITASEYVDETSGEVKRQITLDEKAQLFIIENLDEIVRTTK